VRFRIGPNKSGSSRRRPGQEREKFSFDGSITKKGKVMRLYPFCFCSIDCIFSQRSSSSQPPDETHANTPEQKSAGGRDDETEIIDSCFYIAYAGYPHFSVIHI